METPMSMLTMRISLALGFLAVASPVMLEMRPAHAQQASAAFCSYYPYHPNCLTPWGYIDPYTGRHLPPPRSNVPWDPNGDGSGTTGGYTGGGYYQPGRGQCGSYGGRCLH